MNTEFQVGDRVRVTRSLIYSGKTGYLMDNSGLFNDPWDFNLELDEGKVIGVNKQDIRLEPTEEEVAIFAKRVSSALDAGEREAIRNYIHHSQHNREGDSDGKAGSSFETEAKR